jgi:predicted secreted hydrolase
MKADARGRGIASLAVATVFWGLLVACSSGTALRPVPSPSAPEPTPAPRPVSIPADEARHSDRLEWWYYNGHLTASTGEEFGFSFAIFQSLDPDGNPVYSSQFGLTDVAGQEHSVASRLFAGDASKADAGVFGLQLSDWSLDIESDSHAIRGLLGEGSGFDLLFERDPDVPPVLQAGIGWFPTPTGWSYYYSFPDMTASGRMLLGGKAYEVTGTGWFDHQWGDFFAIGAPAGWQWFALHLGDGRTMMVSETRDAQGEQQAVFGSLSNRQGETRTITDADGVSIEVLDTWRSPNTGAEYPSRWRVVVDSLRLDVEVVPVLADQEVTVGVPRAAIYWEGKVSVDGVFGESEVQQPGYVELTGYVSPEPVPWRGVSGN